MSILQRLTVPFKIARIWNAALDRSSERRYSEALDCILRIYELLGTGEVPSFDVYYEFNLLLAHIQEKLLKFGEAIKVANLASQQIKLNKRLSEPDRTYLLHYCAVILAYCYSRTGRESEAQKFDAALADNLQLDRVSGHLRSKFPVDPT